MGDLVDDVLLLLPASTGDRGHFYGGMVAIKIPDSSEPSSNTYEIVDGQQRLATFCLLLAQLAMRADRLESIANEQGYEAESRKLNVLAKGIRNEYLYYQRYDVDKGTESREPRIRLSRVDDDIFQALLQGSHVAATRESHHKLRKAATYLREELVEPTTPENDLPKAREALHRLRDAVLLDSFVIHIVGDSRSSGYRLFAVLNDRGSRLQIADLLRSHTLELLDSHPKLRDQCADVWDDILEDGAEGVDEFLRTYYASLTGAKKPAPDALFDKVKSLLYSTDSEPQNILESLKSMSSELTDYLIIKKGEWPYAARERYESVNDWQRSRLYRLVNTLHHESAGPLLLAAKAHCSEGEFADLVHIIELFAFRYKNVCGAHIGPAQAIYYNECRRLRSNLGGVADFVRLRTGLQYQLDRRASDSVFRNAIKDRLHYDAGGAAKANIRELLTAIEDYQQWIRQGSPGNPQPSMITVTDLSLVTIEHIYPQGCTRPDPVLESNVNRLGNLSYWAPTDNSEAGNAPFSEKKPAYAMSPVGLNKELASLQSWDLSALESREEELINQACLIFSVWRLP